MYCLAMIGWVHPTLKCRWSNEIAMDFVGEYNWSSVDFDDDRIRWSKNREVYENKKIPFGKVEECLTYIDASNGHGLFIENVELNGRISKALLIDCLRSW